MTPELLEASASENFRSPLVQGERLFTGRDLRQTVFTSAVLRLQNRTDTTVRSEGIYLLNGSYRDTTVFVDAGDEAVVQLVLDSFSVSNSSKPVIHVNSADKVFITTRGGDSSLEVTGTFDAGSGSRPRPDAVIFSRSDLVLNGTGALSVNSARGNGISSKDDLKITGGVLTVESQEDGIEANDSIRIYDGGITIISGKDGLHSENEDNPWLGYIYIGGGSLDILAADDGIQANSFLQIDGGKIHVERSTEGLEANLIQINGGLIDIYAVDDGINAARKGPLPVIAIAVNGGETAVEVGPGDTDAFDANGDIFINGGVVRAQGRSTFDADRQALLSGGRVFVNGEEVSELPVHRWGGRN